MISEELKSKLEKVYALVENGATAGERQAAREALDRLVEKYGFDPEKLDDIKYRTVRLTYKTQLDVFLIYRLIGYFFEERSGEIITNGYKQTSPRKAILIKLTNLEAVTMVCAYEYFRKHMNKQWNELCVPVIKRKRTSRSKKITRAKLQEKFFSSYVIKSNMAKQEEIKRISFADLSEEEVKQTMLMDNVVGGNYNTQVQSAHMLNQKNEAHDLVNG